MPRVKMFALVVVPLALVGVACGGGSPSTSTPSASDHQTGSGMCSPTGSTIQLSARDNTYNTDCIAAPANTAFTISFDNMDSGVPHNVAIFSNEQMTLSVFKGDIVTGPKEVSYQVGALAAGTYHFHCDVHPTQMRGELVVSG